MGLFDEKPKEDKKVEVTPTATPTPTDDDEGLFFGIYR